ncbi:hypothetical protein LCGC14_1247720 [marine sediment metagenome]|uniref:Uncharacterized protein n=2 Tax=marine sediment metagenome TaxID=412755 RepID=A0A0F9NL85_9ZZZZ
MTDRRGFIPYYGRAEPFFTVRPFTNQHQPRRSTMERTGTARAEPGKAPESMPDIEAMCARASEVRKQADRLRIRAREVEVRILGPQPAEEASPAVAAANVPCLTGVIGALERETTTALRDVGHSLDRLFRSLGSVGQE